MTRTCSVCQIDRSDYVCPKCNVPYCSLACYKQHSASCTAEFESEQVREVLGSVVASLDDQTHMKDVLVRMHRQHLEDECLSADEGEDDFVGGMAYSRAVAFAEGNLTLEDLTESERESLKAAVNSSLLDVDSVVKAWSPWWEQEEVKDVTLSAQGTPVVQDLEGWGSTAMSSIPQAPASPLPFLSSLTSKDPSPLLMYHLVDLLFWYTLVLRLLNGDCESVEADVTCLLLSCSKALTPEKQITEDIGLENFVADILQTACIGVKKYFGSIPRGMAIGAVRDVATIVSLGRCGAILALSDLLRILLRSKNDLIHAKFDGKRASRKVTLTKIERKLIFMLAWANETIDEAWKLVLQSQLLALYKEHMASLDKGNENKAILLTRK